MESKERSLRITGMHCASCVDRVRRALVGVEGVEDARVDLVGRRALVRGAFAPERAVAALERAGYGGALERAGGGPEPDDGEAVDARRRFLQALALSVPLMAAEHVAHAASTAVQGALALAVLLGPARAILRGALRRVPTMDTLLGLGLVTAVAHAGFELAVASGGHVYLGAVGMIVTFVQLGRWLEALARDRARRALRDLAGLLPQRVRVRRGEREVEVPPTAVEVGDLVLVGPGDRLAVDGVVVEGEAAVDESPWTGEPLPRWRRVRDPVRSASLVVDGSFVYRARQVGDETELERTLGVLRSAQASRPRVQRLVDRVAAVFVPCVVALALLALGVHLAVNDAETAVRAALSVLLIACPCALGLATPLAIALASAHAARRGILVRSIESLERALAIDLLLVDKTGTLTTGRPEIVAETWHVGASQRERLLPALVAVEARSRHPIARAFVEAHADVARPPVEAFFLREGGIEARAGGVDVLLGAPAFLRSRGVDVPPVEAPPDGSAVHFAAAGTVVASLVAVDPLRPSTHGALAALRARGVEVALASGDSSPATEHVAEVLGIEERRGGLRPEDKLAWVEAARAAGRRVGFAGDGLNDGPALAAADLSFALGEGVQVAQQTADVVLVSGDLARIAETLDLARRTRRIIVQNLGWAFAYNVAALPLAAAGWLHPVVAAAAMAGSSVSVALNSLRVARRPASSPEVGRRDSSLGSPASAS